MLRRMIASKHRRPLEAACRVSDADVGSGMWWESVADPSDNESCRLSFPNKHVAAKVFGEPDCVPANLGFTFSANGRMFDCCYSREGDVGGGG